MPAQDEERGRVLGVPISGSGPGWVGDEQQRVLGFPADWVRLPRLGPAVRRIRGLLSAVRGQDAGRRGR